MKVQIFTLLSVCVKIYQIFVIFETTDQLFFKFCILSTKGAYETTNLVKFCMSSRNPEILHFAGSFCPNHIQFQPEKYRRVSHDTEE